MRRTASEVIRELEMRIARLEANLNQKTASRYAEDMYAEDMYAEDMYAEDMYAEDMYDEDMYDEDMYDEDESMDGELLAMRLADDLTAEEVQAVKHLSPAQAKAISKAMKKSWKSNKNTRIKSMTKARNKSNPDRAKNRRQRSKYKSHV